MLGADCLRANSWVCGRYLSTREGQIIHYTLQHLSLSVLSIALGLLFAVPLSILALYRRWLRAGILSALGIIYTIPSLALFVLLQPWLGVTHATPVVIALVAYSQLLLVRNFLVGLDEVPADVIDAAKGMGYGPVALLWRVRLPLALPAIFAGLRVTTVSTVALLTVGGVINQGGLGTMLFQGFQDDVHAQVLLATVLIVVLALVGDGIVLVAQWLAIPWQRRAPA
ncbi:MAG: ABC transporter permease [Acidimicrobiales bacterium]